jgi:hypothetical protein
MLRGGVKRLDQRLGIGLLILSLAHVPLPMPGFHAAGRRGESSGSFATGYQQGRGYRAARPSDEGSELYWHWVAVDEDLLDQEIDDDDGPDEDLVLVPERAKDASCGANETGFSPHLASAHRVRMHLHLLRPAKSKRVWQGFADPSVSARLTDARVDSTPTGVESPARTPDESMLQRWRC